MELNSKKRISINVIFSVLQVGIVGLIYLVIYKILLNKLGVEQLGVWSLILATTSIASLANFGITSGIVKFVAEFYAEGDLQKTKKLVYTTFYASLLFFIVVCSLLYPIARYVLKFIIEPKYLDIAIKILPISLISLVINSISGVFTSVFEGIQKNYIRNVILILGAILFLIFTNIFLDKYGLMGAAYSQIIQSFFILVVSILLLKKEFNSFFIFKFNWDFKLFKEIASFGLKFQLISIFVMLFDPITKGLISKFGGLSYLGYYEMANKLVFQIRAFIVNANQVMIPVITHSLKTKVEGVKQIYLNSLDVTIFVDVLMLIGLLLFTPIISIVWIGTFQPEFVITMVVLSISVFLNILNGPAYFSCIAENKIKLLLHSHVLTAVLNVVLGLIIGFYFKGLGVILSSSFSFIIGSLYVVFKYHKENLIENKFLYSSHNFKNIITIIFAGFLFLQYNVISNYFEFYQIIVIYTTAFLIFALFTVLNNKKIKSIIK